MKTSELIRLLQRSIEDNGDLPVVIADHDGWSDVREVLGAIPVNPTPFVVTRSYVDQRPDDPDHMHVNAIG